MKQTKRRRGGQQGNQNARKHGFYSRVLTVEQVGSFWAAVSQEHVDPEVALMRVKLQSLFANAPLDARTLKSAARLIVKWTAIKIKMNRSQRAYFKACILTVLEHNSGISLGNMEKRFTTIMTFESKSGKGIKGLFNMLGSSVSAAAHQPEK
jgi:hypothetical protein